MIAWAKGGRSDGSGGVTAIPKNIGHDIVPVPKETDARGKEKRSSTFYRYHTTMLTYQGWITNMEKEAPDAVQPLPSP